MSGENGVPMSCNFHDLTEYLLEGLLLNSFNSVLVEGNQAKIKKAVSDYFADYEHGVKHSQGVWSRCRQIIANAPNVWRLALSKLPEADNWEILFWSSVMHDFSRFLEIDFAYHEKTSADLSSQIFAGRGREFAGILWRVIAWHDYFCPLANGRPLPVEIMHPLAEIFRLADKTSVSPEQEVMRYYETGKKTGTPFFNPDLPDSARYDFVHNQKQRDQLTWLLLIFTMQPTDFIYKETSWLYQRWLRGKATAMAKVRELAAKEKDINGQPIDQEKVTQIILNLYKPHELVDLLD